jgi:hypothetical protein
MNLCKEQPNCPIYFACIHGEPHWDSVFGKVVYCENVEDNNAKG